MKKTLIILVLITQVAFSQSKSHIDSLPLPIMVSPHYEAQKLPESVGGNTPEKSSYQLEIDAELAKTQHEIDSIEKERRYIDSTGHEHYYPALKICESIECKTDQFTNDRTYERPFDNLETYIHLEKLIKANNEISYYLFLTATDYTCVVRERGVIILFTDGSKMQKDIPIDCDAKEGYFEYSAALRLTKSDMDVLKTKIIKAFRLYLFDKDIINGEDYRRLFNCLLEKK